MQIIDKIKGVFKRSFYKMGDIVLNFNNPSEALILDTKEAVESAYSQTPVLAGIINYSATLSSKAKLFYTTKKDSVEVSFGDYMNSSNDTFEYLTKDLMLYNYTFLQIKTATPNIFDLKNTVFKVISPIEIDIKFKSNINYNNVTKISNFIESISYKNSKENISLTNLLLIKSIRISEIVESKFKLKSAQESINIIRAVNLMLDGVYRKKGGFGVMTNSRMFDGSPMPLDDEVVNKLQKDYSKYGFSRDALNTAITDADLKYLDLTPDVRKTDTKTSVQQAQNGIADVLGFPIQALNVLSGQTFNNKEEAEKQIYKAVIIAIWEKITDSLNTYFKADLLVNDSFFSIDFTTIEALQKDYKTEYEISNMKTNSIINLQNNINSGVLTLEQATLMLEEFYGYDEQLIKTLLTDKKDIQDDTEQTQ